MSSSYNDLTDFTNSIIPSTMPSSRADSLALAQGHRQLVRDQICLHNAIVSNEEELGAFKDVITSRLALEDTQSVDLRHVDECMGASKSSHFVETILGWTQLSGWFRDNSPATTKTNVRLGKLERVEQMVRDRQSKMTMTDVILADNSLWATITTRAGARKELNERLEALHPKFLEFYADSVYVGLSTASQSKDKISTCFGGGRAIYEELLWPEGERDRAWAAAARLTLEDYLANEILERERRSRLALPIPHDRLPGVVTIASDPRSHALRF